MNYTYSNKNIFRNFLLSSVWFFVILLAGLLLLIADKYLYAAIVGGIFCICYFPRLALFVNHYQYSRRNITSIDVANQELTIESNGKKMTVSYEDVEKIQQCLSGSFFSRTSGIIQTTWEDFFFSRIVLKNGKSYCISSLILKRTYFSPYGIKEERKFCFFPWIK